MNLLDLQNERKRKKNAPLADRMRPERLEDFYGHKEILGPGKPLARLIQADRIPSMIFFGPPGSGKTSLAYVIAKTSRQSFQKLSAVSAGVKEVREIVQKAKDALTFESISTILFIDEIHRFNKSQQDALLPFVENGTLTLIGATTENPFFEVNKALLSRCQVVELKLLEREALERVLDRALKDPDKGLGREKIRLTPRARQALITLAGGDARILLNTLEIAFLSTPQKEGESLLDEKDITESAQKKIISYDKGAEEHYNTISAFIKSVRGSDPDAAIYYLARMLAGGEDPLFIARRLCILASEDIGNAQPLGILVANACFQEVSQIGMPEARIILAQTTIFLAGAPKSNSAYLAIDKALDYVQKNPPSDIPPYLKDAHYAGAKKLGRGLEYLYPHAFPGAAILQKYLPFAIMNIKFYQPLKRGYEAKISQYLEETQRLAEENARPSEEGGDNAH